MSYLQKRTDRDRAARERSVGQGTQEVARLKTLVAASQKQLVSLQDQMRTEHEAITNICSTYDSQTDGEFGIFASADGLLQGLDDVRVNIQRVHNMDAEARGFALAHLGDRFDQLRSLSKQLRKVVTISSTVYDTLDLSDTLDAINQVAGELLDTAKVRMLSVILFTQNATETADSRSEVSDRYINIANNHGFYA